MDYSSQTVAQLRSLLNSDGKMVPQAYMKKAELVAMCQNHFGNGGRQSRMSSSSETRGRSKTSRSSSSASRKSSSGSRRAGDAASFNHASRRKSSIGTKGHKSPSITILRNIDAKSPPLKKAAEVSGAEDFRRTPSPVGRAGKTFSGRPSLAGQSSSRKISIVPMATLPPPRRKSLTAVKSESSRYIWAKRSLVFLLIVSISIAIYIFTASNAPRVPLCNTDGTPPHTARSFCAPCPKLGKCSNGFLTACAEHNVIRGDLCVRDEAKFMNAISIVDAISSRLVSLKGQKECGEEVADSVYPEQLRLWLRSDFSRLSDEQYRSAFDLAINGEMQGIVLPKHVVQTQLGLIRSSFGVKTFSCITREFLTQYLWTIILVGFSSVFLIGKLRKWSQKKALIKSIVNCIQDNTMYVDARVQGLTVTDLRDEGMPLKKLDEQSARIQMNSILKAYPDIQCGEDMTRGGEMVFWSAQKIRSKIYPPQR